MEPESAGSAGPPWQGRLQQQQAGTGSPYDYVKAGVGSAERAVALGLTPTRLNDSYGGNARYSELPKFTLDCTKYEVFPGRR